MKMAFVVCNEVYTARVMEILEKNGLFRCGIGFLHFADQLVVPARKLAQVIIG